MSDSLTFRLSILEGPSAGGAFDIVGDVINIGRDAANDIVLNDNKVSRFHVRLTRQGAGFTIEDLDSANGTTVNGRRVTAPHSLSPGDRITLGTESVIQFDAVGPGQTAPTASRQRAAFPVLLVLGGGAVGLAIIACLLIGGWAWLNNLIPFGGAPPLPVASPTATSPARQATATRSATPTPLTPTATSSPTATDTPTFPPTNTPRPPTFTPPAPTSAVRPTNTPAPPPPSAGGPLTFRKVSFVSAKRVAGTQNDADATLSLEFSGGAAPYQVLNNDGQAAGGPQPTGKFTADGKEWMYIYFTQRTSCGANLTASVTLISADGQRIKNSYYIASVACP